MARRTLCTYSVNAIIITISQPQQQQQQPHQSSLPAATCCRATYDTEMAIGSHHQRR